MKRKTVLRGVAALAAAGAGVLMMSGVASAATVNEVAASVTTTTVTTSTPFSVKDDAATVEQGSSVTIDVLANDTGDDLKVTSIETQPAHGTAAIVNGKVVYTASPTYQGKDTIVVKITDKCGQTKKSTITVTVAQSCGVPLIAPVFALGSLALGTAGVGGRALTKRRRAA